MHVHNIGGQWFDRAERPGRQDRPDQHERSENQPVDLAAAGGRRAAWRIHIHGATLRETSGRGELINLFATLKKTGGSPLRLVSEKQEIARKPHFVFLGS
jgi:hypothetical protein